MDAAADCEIRPRPRTPAQVRLPSSGLQEIKFIQMETMGKVRDTATVVVQAGTSETETWKLLWRTENAYLNRPREWYRFCS